MGDVRSKDLAQRFVQQMRRRVIGAGCRATGVIDFEFNGIARLERTAFNLAHMHKQVAQLFLRGGHAEQRSLGTLDDALIANLAAGLAIERCLIEDQPTFVSGFQRLDLSPARYECRHLAFGRFGIVAQKFCRPEALLDIEPDGFGRLFARALPGLAGIGPLLVHGDSKRLGIDRDAARAQRIFREIEREAERVVEFERNVAGEHRTLFERAGRIAE